MRIGIDLGGTKIEAIALDDAGREIFRRRIPSPQGDYGQTLDAITGLVAQVEAHTGRRGQVGLGIPGAIAASGLVKNANSTWLIGQPLQRDLEARLARAVRISNDANCFVLSEATDGAGRDAAVVFGIIVGTGTGGGWCIHGRVIEGVNAIAGEWGHNPLPWPASGELPGRPCYCGQHGCIETWLSGPGLAADYRQRGGAAITAKDIVARAAQGEALAEAALQAYEDRMARAIASVINVLDPDVIVLGGGLSNVARLYHNVPHRWGRYVFSDTVDTRLLPPVHGDASGVRGAAWLW
jgi:fructokinase